MSEPRRVHRRSLFDAFRRNASPERAFSLEAFYDARTRAGAASAEIPAVSPRDPLTTERSPEDDS